MVSCFKKEPVNTIDVTFISPNNLHDQPELVDFYRCSLMRILLIASLDRMICTRDDIWIM